MYCNNKKKTSLFTKFFFKILRVDEFYILNNKKIEKFDKIAYKKCKLIKSVKDIFKLETPHKFPIFFFYDYFLKKNRIPTFTTKYKEKLIYDYSEILATHHELDSLFTKKIDIFLTSHTSTYNLSSICWTLIRKFKTQIFHIHQEDRNITIRKYKTLNEFKDQGKDIVTFRDLATADKKIKTKLISKGKRYINSLIFENSKEINNTFGAYDRKNKKILIKSEKDLLKNHGFHENLPIAVIYLNCLTDFPNEAGETWYKDYFIWTNKIIELARKNTNVNFILKPHPAEKKFNVFLKEVYKTQDFTTHNLSYFNKKISDLDLIKYSKFIITNVGSIAHEALHFDKIVIAARKNFVNSLGLTYSYKNNSQLSNLFNKLHLLKNKFKNKKYKYRKKNYFYMYYGARFTKYKNYLVYPNHFFSDNNCFLIKNYLIENLKEIKKEIDMIKKWKNLKYKNFSVYKSLNYF